MAWVFGSSVLHIFDSPGFQVEGCFVCHVGSVPFLFWDSGDQTVPQGVACILSRRSGCFGKDWGLYPFYKRGVYL